MESQYIFPADTQWRVTFYSRKSRRIRWETIVTAHHIARAIGRATIRSWDESGMSPDDLMIDRVIRIT